MKILAIAAACLVPLAASAAAGADEAAALREVRATAECVVEQKANLVADLLGTLPGSDEENRAAARLKTIYATCSGDKFALAISKSSQGLFNGRSGLAAAAVVSAGMDGRGVNTSRVQGAQAWYAHAIAGKTAGRGYDAVAINTQEFGTCVVRAAPEGAVQLVRSRTGSAEEEQALAAITPVLSGCVFQGKPISMNRNHLRLMIAEPLYHAIVDGPSAGRRS
ncbi:MAG: hypothetical protein P0Y59_01010 [Candidatus Sphingomonas phytovorans]|nr:hypothetical protein [Sphingomonas sp.]WEK00308.1 MAG: hypothetical protein P0Y59_01010 [Sphingomonas sp.]